MSRVIVVANQKGGVGKTTTAINVAASLAILEKRTLLIDCDPQSNATSGLGFDPTEVDKNIYSILHNPISAIDSVLKTELSNLDLIASTHDLAGAEVELVNLQNREFLFKKIVANFQNDYDFIFLDCPPTLGLIAVNALSAGTELLIPMQCEYFAMEGLAQLLKTFEAIKRNLNPELSICGIALTMFDKRNRISFQVEDEIRTHCSKEVFLTKIPRNVRLAEAPSFGKPAVLYDIRSLGTQAYMELAKEILNRAPKQC